MFYTYIVECADGTYYTGKTHDLRKRLDQHNGKLAGGGKYTRSRRPVFLRYYEQVVSQSEAMRREYSLKQCTRKQKEILIRNSKFCLLQCVNS